MNRIPVMDPHASMCDTDLRPQQDAPKMVLVTKIGGQKTTPVFVTPEKNGEQVYEGIGTVDQISRSIARE